MDQSLGEKMHDKDRLYPKPKFLVLAEAHLFAKFGPNILDFFDLVYLHTFIGSPCLNSYTKVVPVPNSTATIFVNLTFQPIPKSLKK